MAIIMSIGTSIAIVESTTIQYNVCIYIPRATAYNRQMSIMFNMHVGIASPSLPLLPLLLILPVEILPLLTLLLSGLLINHSCRYCSTGSNLTQRPTETRGTLTPGQLNATVVDFDAVSSILTVKPTAGNL